MAGLFGYGWLAGQPQARGVVAFFIKMYFKEGKDGSCSTCTHINAIDELKTKTAKALEV